MDKKEDYIVKHIQFAVNAGKKYGINPLFILADGAIEGAWATSYSALHRNNNFGMTAYGKTNPYWKGTKSQSTSSGLYFRVYATMQDSFYDFAYQIKNFYATVAAQTTIEGFADAISKSKYISKANGDNPEIYKKLLISIYNDIVAIAKKKNCLPT